MNELCKVLKNNDHLFFISQMPRFKHCIFYTSITQKIYPIMLFCILHFPLLGALLCHQTDHQTTRPTIQRKKKGLRRHRPLQLMNESEERHT